MKPADLVKASDAFLKDIASRGIPEIRETKPGTTSVADYMLQNIGVATEAFASYNDVKVDDKDLFHRMEDVPTIRAPGPRNVTGPAS
jgi:hypothetical protein